MSTMAQVIRDAMAADVRMGHGTNVGALKATSLNVGASGSEVEITATPAELNQVDGNVFVGMTPGTGIAPVTNSSYVARVTKVGTMFKTEILIDLTGLRSTAGGDIIGDDGTALPCHIGQITAAVNGTIFAGRISCLEAPTGGDPDIDLFAATSGTAVEDTAISGVTGQAQLVNAGDHSAGGFDMLTAFPAANAYLYLVAGDTTDADYTAGILLIELWGK
jgi:hypothetical protein